MEQRDTLEFVCHVEAMNCSHQWYFLAQSYSYRHFYVTMQHGRTLVLLVLGVLGTGFSVAHVAKVTNAAGASCDGSVCEVMSSDQSDQFSDIESIKGPTGREEELEELHVGMLQVSAGLLPRESTLEASELRKNTKKDVMPKVHESIFQWLEGDSIKSMLLPIATAILLPHAVSFLVAYAIMHKNAEHSTESEVLQEKQEEPKSFAYIVERIGPMWLIHMLGIFSFALGAPSIEYLYLNYFARQQSHSQIDCSVQMAEAPCAQSIMKVLHLAIIRGFALPFVQFIVGPALGAFSDAYGRRPAVLVIRTCLFIAQAQQPWHGFPFQYGLTLVSVSLQWSLGGLCLLLGILTDSIMHQALYTQWAWLRVHVSFALLLVLPLEVSWAWKWRYLLNFWDVVWPQCWLQFSFCRNLFQKRNGCRSLGPRWRRQQLCNCSFRARWKTHCNRCHQCISLGRLLHTLWKIPSESHGMDAAKHLHWRTRGASLPSLVAFSWRESPFADLWSSRIDGCQHNRGRDVQHPTNAFQQTVANLQQQRGAFRSSYHGLSGGRWDRGQSRFGRSAGHATNCPGTRHPDGRCFGAGSFRHSLQVAGPNSPWGTSLEHVLIYPLWCSFRCAKSTFNILIEQAWWKGLSSAKKMHAHHRVVCLAAWYSIDLGSLGNHCNPADKTYYKIL